MSDALRQLHAAANVLAESGLRTAKTNDLCIAVYGAIDEITRLREALEKCRPLLCRAHDRIHALPRATDTELANEIDAALGGIRAALAEKDNT